MDIISITESSNVIVDKPTSTIIVTSQMGPRGLPGASGETTISGTSVVIAPTIAAGDLLAYDGTNWINTAKDILTEGGNF
jgi:hypothetical protein